MDYRNNIFTFSKVSEAQKFINYVNRILSNYQRVTLADLYDYAYNASYDYKANQVVWLEETLTSRENTICPVYDSYKNWWCVKFPEPDQYPACEPTYHNYAHHDGVKPKQTPTPEPFNITINIPDITRTTVWYITDIIKQANEIKDRPVFITIN